MIVTIGQLRRIIREAGLDSDMRNMAGSFNPAGTNFSVRDREAILNPPPALGSEDEAEKEKDDEEYEQEKSQPVVRALDRRGGAYRQDGA